MYEQFLNGIAEYHVRDPIRDLRNYSTVMSLSQVVKFFSKYGIHYTNTTVQHYVRIGILPPPVKRKYNRRHIVLLAMAACMRNAFSLDEIRDILLFIPPENTEAAYSTLMEFMRADIKKTEEEQAAENDIFRFKLALAARSVVAKTLACIRK